VARVRTTSQQQFRYRESVDRPCENDSGIYASRIAPLASSGNASIIQERQG